MNLKSIKNIITLLISLVIILFLVELIGYNSITLSFIGLLIVIFAIMFLYNREKFTQIVNVNKNLSQKEIESTKEEYVNKRSKIFIIFEILIIFSIIFISILIFYSI